MATEYPLYWGSPITCHAFNKDRTQVAVAPGDHQVHIYQQQQQQGWTLIHTLAEHDKLVTSIDWAPNTNRIVTCSQDRNAYVWVLDATTHTWKPTLVLLRINRAATFVRWSPHENKFAVASGARLISICYFEEDNDWWVSKHLKKPIRSTVLSLDWHPDNILLVAGSTDMKTRVFSAFIKGVDQKASSPVWGDKLPFGTVCAEFGSQNSGWVHSVAFSPSGNTIAWVSHDSSISIASGTNTPVQVLQMRTLPLMTLAFTSETGILAAGYDCALYGFSCSSAGVWKSLDKVEGEKKRAFTANTAFDKFKAMDVRGSASLVDTDLPSVHQNTVTGLRVLAPNTISTSGLDGKLVVWDLLALGVGKL